jgi:hypothetical protein
MDAFPGGVFSDIRGAGGFGHPFHFMHESGAQVFCGSKRDDQPVVVNASGQVCEVFAEQLVKMSVELGGSVTRLDLAADLQPPELARRRLVEMRRAWKRGQVETRLQEATWYDRDGPDAGTTLYLGATGGARQLCAYDRRGPLRLEWRFRPEKGVGRLVPAMLQEKGAAAMWRSVARAAVFPMSWYQELLQGDEAEWSAPAVEGASLVAAIEAVRSQFGQALWAFEVLGMTLADVVVEPEKPRGDVLRKLMSWAHEAPQLGYDGERLKKVVRWKSKSRRVRV